MVPPHVNWICCFIIAALGGVPRVAAFAPPGPEARRQAIGHIDSLPDALRRALEPGDAFLPIAAPEPGDWLDAHKEAGQTFDQFVASHPNRPDKSRNRIYLLPLGPLASEGSPALEKLRSFAAAFFQMEVKVLPATEIDEQTFSPRLNRYTKQRQILTTDVLAYLGGRLPPDAFCLLGVTMEDLYPAPSWNYVFGQASLRERVGVYSFVRYEDLARFYRAEGWTAETEWVRRRLAVNAGR